MSYLSSDGKVSRIYSNFRGVDFRGDEVNLIRSPDSKNMWKDYKETESIRTRPGMKKVHQCDGGMTVGLFFYNDEMFAINSSSGMYRVSDGKQFFVYDEELENEYPALSDIPFRHNAFIYGNVWYLLGNGMYLKYDGNTLRDVVGYVPTTSIARRPAGGGTIHEDVNLLTPWRKNSFLADGESTEFYLDSEMGGFDFPKVWVNGELLPQKFPVGTEPSYRFESNPSRVIFTEAPPAPDTDGQDNVVVEFRVANDGSDKIKNCRLLQVFDNRVFVSGNPDYPSMVWHCSLNDPSYFSDLDYYKEGLDNANVTGLVAGNNALWVFREPSDGNTTVFYHTPTIDADYGKIYPSQHSSVSTGCVGGAINFNDDIVFFSNKGMEGISGDVTTEQVIAHRSTLVDRKLTTEKKYKDMVLAEWEGYLVVFMGNKAYLADSRATFSHNNHLEYDWFYWELDKNVTCASVHDGVLYVGTDDGGIYTFTDFEADIESYWTTPKDKFKYPQRLKTTNKRGCVVEATGDVSVYAKLEDTDFELIGKYENITDYFVCRIKRKKFKDLQLRFYSDKRFSLETATIETFVGGYIKR